MLHKLVEFHCVCKDYIFRYLYTRITRFHHLTFVAATAVLKAILMLGKCSIFYVQYNSLQQKYDVHMSSTQNIS